MIVEEVVTARFNTQPQSKLGMENNKHYFATNYGVSGYNLEFWWKLLSKGYGEGSNLKARHVWYHYYLVRKVQ